MALQFRPYPVQQPIDEGRARDIQISNSLMQALSYIAAGQEAKRKRKLAEQEALYKGIKRGRETEEYERGLEESEYKKSLRPLERRKLQAGVESTEALTAKRKIPRPPKRAPEDPRLKARRGFAKTFAGQFRKQAPEERDYRLAGQILPEIGLEVDYPMGPRRPAERSIWQRMRGRYPQEAAPIVAPGVRPIPEYALPPQDVGGPAPTAPQGMQLTQEALDQFLIQANFDPDLAQQLAIQEGYIVP